jgi:hypothetical protein
MADRDHVAHFLGAFIHEEYEKLHVRLVYRDSFDHRLQQHGLASACGSNDESALSIPNWSNQIDGAARQFRPSLGWSPRLERELAIRVRCNERREFRSPQRGFGIAAIDRQQLRGCHAAALISTDCAGYKVAAAKACLTNKLCGNERVVCFGEVALRRAAKVARVALRIKETRRFTLDDYWTDRAAWRVVYLRAGPAIVATAAGKLLAVVVLVWSLLVLLSLLLRRLLLIAAHLPVSVTMAESAEPATSLSAPLITTVIGTGGIAPASRVTAQVSLTDGVAARISTGARFAT